jgi:hypothetical protein
MIPHLKENCEVCDSDAAPQKYWMWHPEAVHDVWRTGKLLTCLVPSLRNSMSREDEDELRSCVPFQ